MKIPSLVLTTFLGPAACLPRTPRPPHPQPSRTGRTPVSACSSTGAPSASKAPKSAGRAAAQVPIEEYDNLYKQFNPTKFNADEWVAVAKAAGMKYMVLTTKHHDGFCLWDTKQTDYNIMNTPFKRDVVKELAAACKKGGIAFGTYYSTCDWHHPDFPLTSPGGKIEAREIRPRRPTPIPQGPGQRTAHQLRPALHPLVRRAPAIRRHPRRRP